MRSVLDKGEGDPESAGWRTRDDITWAR